MRLNGSRPVERHKFVSTADSKHAMAISPNVLNRRFEQALPKQVWICDITDIGTQSSCLCLAAMLDLHSRKIVGWATFKALPAVLVCAASQMVIVQGNQALELIVHPERDTPYASAEHQALLAKHGLKGRMCRKGNYWRNNKTCIVMEHFFLNLKMVRV